MFCNDLEQDIYSIYPYKGENIEEIICRLQAKINELSTSGKVFDAEQYAKDLEAIRNKIADVNKKQISINDFGGIGDGTTPNDKAFKDAMEYCWANKIFNLYIPDGVYYVTKPIETKEVKLIGLSTPVAPYPIDHDYAKPQSSVDGYRTLLPLLGGSVITSDKEIDIFKDGLYAENIMIVGNCRATNQNGIGQTNGGRNNWVMLNNVTIICCGNDGIHAPYGLISPRITNCRITQNMRHGLYIGKEVGTYTGETNDVIIRYNDFNRSGKNGIKMDVNGRAFFIEHNSFEYCGFADPYPSTPPIPLVYGCDVILNGNPSMATGEFVFNKNYSESTYGLLNLNAPYYTATGITINNNFFHPHTQASGSIGVNLSGEINHVEVKGNKWYAPTRLKVTRSVKGIETDSYIDNEDTDNRNISIKTKMGDYNPVTDIFNLGYEQFGKAICAGGIASCQYRDGYTSYYLNPAHYNDSKVGFNITDKTAKNKLVGNLVWIDDRWGGYVTSVQENQIVVKGNFEDICSNITQKEMTFYEVGGYYFLNGSGKKTKLVCDESNGIFGIVKE